MEESTKIIPVSDTDKTIVLRRRQDECTELIISVLSDLCTLERELSTAEDVSSSSSSRESSTAVQAIEQDVYMVEDTLTHHVVQREQRLAKSSSYLNDYVNAFASSLLNDRPNNLHRFVSVNLNVILGMVDDLTTLAMELGTARLAMVLTRSMKSRLDEKTMTIVNENCRERCHCDVATIDAEQPYLVSNCQSALLNAIRAYLRRQDPEVEEVSNRDWSEVDGARKLGVPESKTSHRKMILLPALLFLVFLTSLFCEAVFGLLSSALSFSWRSVDQLALLTFCDVQDPCNWHGSLWYPVGLRHFGVPPF